MRGAGSAGYGRGKGARKSERAGNKDEEPQGGRVRSQENVARKPKATSTKREGSRYASPLSYTIPGTRIRAKESCDKKSLASKRRGRKTATSSVR